MWLTLVIVGVAASGFAWLVQRRFSPHTGLILGLIGALSVAFAGFWILAGPETLGPQHWWQQSPWREMSLFTAMLLGMAVRSVTKAIEDRRGALAKWQKAAAVGVRPGLEIDKWEFAYPLLISAITFGSLLSQIKDDQPTLANLLLSFQTGFFWQTLLTTRAHSR